MSTNARTTGLGLALLALGLSAGGCIEGKDRQLDGGAPHGDGLALDPRLEVPPSSNRICSRPGDIGECTFPEMCTFFNKVDGRCVKCTRPIQTCGNPNDPCEKSGDCDPSYACFDGRCALHCILGSLMCGMRPDCLDIGHPLIGVCKQL